MVILEQCGQGRQGKLPIRALLEDADACQDAQHAVERIGGRAGCRGERLYGLRPILEHIRQT
jgi:hypothetical protein